jgi:thioredoxin-like negative regulator of GroEL
MVVERIGCPDNRNDFKRLMEELKSHIVIIKCYAEWCGPCKKIKDEIEIQFDKIRSTDKILMYIDVDEKQDVAAFLKIRSLPTIISYRDGMKHNIMEGSAQDKITHFFRNLKK